jgi:MFS family permease
MQLLAPDILADARGLSAALCVVGLVIGASLWLFGWWSHRFWMVLFTTVLAGIYGLHHAPTLGAQPVVVALLLAVAAGMLALALARLVAFVSAGVAFLAAVQALAPSTEHVLILFLLGGLLGLFLYRLWMMALSSLGGTLLAGYSCLCLLDTLGKMDAGEWAGAHRSLLNGSCIAATLIGLGGQFYLNRRRGEAGKNNNKNGDKPAPPAPKPKADPSPAIRTLWNWGEELFRQAG